MHAVDGDRRLETTVQASIAPWLAAALVAGVALIGSAILVTLLAILLQPPTWLQVVVGAALAVGSAVFAWLLASALRSDR